ncbi:MAG: macro domain-containing protein [Clostridia bacterium]|nr:macro domain-containing protein [Clostridia bacterium]
MPLQIIRNDITMMAVDAIVNAANETLLGGGGVDGAIHRAAGEGLLRECSTLGGCAVGEAKVTGGYALPCKYVIHTVGPVYRGGIYGEEEQLASCYRRSLELARERGCESVAFPLISSGIYGYPKDRALRVAVQEITAFLFENEMTVYIVVFDRASFDIGERLFSDIAEYVDDCYVQTHTDDRRQRVCRTADALPMSVLLAPNAAEDLCEDMAKPSATAEKTGGSQKKQKRKPAFGGKKQTSASSALMEAVPDEGKVVSLDDMLGCLDESFSQMLLRKIDERGMSDVMCYKRANIDRKLFSKIRSDVHYRPSKPTVLAFAIALELSLEETKEMLARAGFALSHSYKFDIIIEYFIRCGNYNIFEINEALFAFDQSLLGA